MANETDDRDKKFATQTAAALELSGYLLYQLQAEMRSFGERLERIVDRQEQNTLALTRLEGRVVRLEEDDEQRETTSERSKRRHGEQAWDLIKLILAAAFGVLAARFFK